MDPFIGEIKLVPYNFAPQGWAFCNGQLMAISQNTALFSLLGTTYGGDGQTTFGLPNLQGKVAVTQGQATSGSNYTLGETAGVPTVTLTTQQMPTHTHQIAVSNVAGTQISPVGHVLAVAPGAVGNVYDPVGKGTIAGNPLNPAGGSQPHDNHQPYLVLNYIIALEGVFPARN